MNDSNFIKTALHYGALCGIGIFIFYLSLYFFGFSVFGEATMLGIWIPIVFTVLAIKFHRDMNLGGAITYRQGLTMGLITTLFSSTLFGLAFYIFIVLYDPAIVEVYKIQAAASIEEGKGVLLSEAMYEKAMESIDLVTSGSLAFSETFNKIIGGAIISLVVAAVLRKPAAPEINNLV
jgi:hypothetical protein